VVEGSPLLEEEEAFFSLASELMVDMWGGLPPLKPAGAQVDAAKPALPPAAAPPSVAVATTGAAAVLAGAE
jgi:hypothetical protein